MGQDDRQVHELSNNDVISSDQDKYYAVSLLLVYRLAPRTFRLRI